MKSFAPAKLTLYLHITGRRDDGYHTLDSLVVFADVGDWLEIKPADTLTLSITGPFSEGLSVSDNLVMQAARLLKETYHIDDGAAITLEKYLPVAAGLGGGSSDAAAVIAWLNQFWDINASLEERIKLVSPLGADMSACLHSRPLRMQGIGEKITPVDAYLPEGYLVLVNPGELLPTASVYGRFAASPHYNSPAEDPVDWLTCSNDLQAPAIELCPVISEVLEMLNSQPGCQTARMCGSGPTCFGWFKNDEVASEAARVIRAAQPDWWVRPAALLP